MAPPALQVCVAWTDGCTRIAVEKLSLTGVPTFDNGPDEFHDGLVRFVKNHKYGFADRNGKIVIAPRGDGAMPFEKGRAKVCLGCMDKWQMAFGG
jgi:hypothetical protein